MPPEDPGGPWRRSPLRGFVGRTVDLDRPIEAMVTMALDPQLVFLKQFRDVECATKACYQAVVEAGLTVTPHGGQLRDETLFRIQIQQYDSHPLAAELLAQSGEQDVACTAAFSADIDFRIALGHEVWRAPT